MAFDFGKLKSLFNFDLGGEGTEQIVGVDIGSSSIKMVQLHMEKNVPTLDTYGELQLGPYADTDVGSVTNIKQERLTESIVDIIRESSVSSSIAGLAVPYASSFATTLTLNTVDEAEIAKRIPVEARKYIPISLNEVALDWFPLSQNAEAKRTRLFLVAMHNEALNRSHNVLTSASLAVAYSELEPFSAARSSLIDSNATVAMIDFGAKATRVYVAGNGMVQRTHGIATGGCAITKAIEEEFSTSFSKAEGLKRDIGLSGEGDNSGVSDVIRRELDRVMHEAGRVIDAHEKDAGEEVTAIIAVGGGAVMPRLLPYATDTLQRQVSLAHPFAKVASPAFLEDVLKEAGPTFSVAVGVALRAFVS